VVSTWLGDHQGRPSAPLSRCIKVSKYGALTNITITVTRPGPRRDQGELSHVANTRNTTQKSNAHLLVYYTICVREHIYIVHSLSVRGPPPLFELFEVAESESLIAL
jgi:hypothetical protein